MPTTLSGVRCGPASSSMLSSRSALNPTAQSFTPANLAVSVPRPGPPQCTKATTAEKDDDSKTQDISLVTIEDINSANFRPPDSSLLSLPAELRNRIYSFALVRTKAIKVGTHSLAADERKHVEPGLLRTCQQTRKECLKMYYQCNTFALKCSVLIAPNIMELESKIPMMRVIRIYVDGLCSHVGRYFRLDVSEGAGKHELGLFKRSGSVWEKGKHGICGHARLLAPAQEYLKGSMDGMTVETLQHLLEILTKCDKT